MKSEALVRRKMDTANAQAGKKLVGPANHIPGLVETEVGAAARLGFGVNPVTPGCFAFFLAVGFCAFLLIEILCLVALPFLLGIMRVVAEPEHVA